MCSTSSACSLRDYDFGDQDVDEAIDMAGVVGTSDAEEPVEEEEKDFVPTHEDLIKLYYQGQKNEGAYFDKKGNICYKDVEPHKFITPEEGSAIKDWTNVSYNMKQILKKRTNVWQR